MKISDRLFSEYGIIGGLFWLIVTLELLMWASLGFPIVTQRTLVLGLQYVKNGGVPLTSLLGALGIVMCFLTGVLLDLTSSLFSIGEAEIFQNHLERNETWLKRVMHQNREYIQKDWPLVLNAEWMKPDWIPRQQLGFVDFIRYFIKLYKSARPYSRIESFLISYVLHTPGAEGNQRLNTQITHWNVSRAISWAIILVTSGISAVIFARMMIITFMVIFRDLNLPSHLSAPFLVLYPLRFLTDLRSSMVSSIWLLFVMLVTEIPLAILARILARNAYRRVCDTLFTLAYVISAKSAGQHS
jgi:hypothetical protein